MDHIACEVAAAVAELGRQSTKDQQLAKLAKLRYLHQPAMPRREQMRLLDITEGADQTYRNWVKRLHQQVMLILTVRSGTTRGYTRRSGSQATNLTRATVLGQSG